jgi:coenzyme F420 biosynthesis associated uncharacterized protein
MSPVPDLVDWDLAAATGVRLLRPGPDATPAQARAVVAQLRDFALEARGHVRAYTGLDVSGTDAPVAVVDRPTWVRSNVEGLRHLLEPMADRIQSRAMAGMPGPVRAVGSRLTALEAGAGLAFLGGKVLGQYEMFPRGAPAGPGRARLLLVAPNIVQVERELGVLPADFRMWVCLHEETHRVQFGAVPWLREHIVEQVGVLLGSAEESLSGPAVRDRAGDVVAAIAAALRGQPGPSLAEALQSPAQQALLAEVTAVMSLLEGHADVVMDDVGPGVVPTVAEIRIRFQRRREEPGRVEAALRRLLGLDAKLRQYRDGAAFVRAVVDRVGMPAFNRVWESAANLPSAAELADPDRWVARVVGTADPAGTDG